MIQSLSGKLEIFRLAAGKYRFQAIHLHVETDLCLRFLPLVLDLGKFNRSNDISVRVEMMFSTISRNHPKSDLREVNDRVPPMALDSMHNSNPLLIPA